MQHLWEKNNNKREINPHQVASLYRVYVRVTQPRARARGYATRTGQGQLKLKLIVLCKEQAGAELGQGQLKLKLGFISIKI